MPTKKEELLRFLDGLKGSKSESFTIIVTTPGCKYTEQITNPIENLDSKRDFYAKAYTDDLTHAMNDKVRIIGWFCDMVSPNPKQRVTIELADLREKIDKLNDFINTEIFSKLSPVNQNLLSIQYNAMVTYGVILETRLHNWKEVE